MRDDARPEPSVPDSDPDGLGFPTVAPVGAATSDMSDMALGLSVGNVNFHLSRLQRNGLIDRQVQVEDDGGSLKATLGAPEIALRMAMSMPETVRLVLDLGAVELDGAPVVGPCRLSLAAPVAMSTLTPEAWRAHRKLMPATRNRLEAYADTRRYEVKQLAFELAEIEPSKALHRDESALPSLDPARLERLLALLGRYLRGLSGLDNPFVLALVVLSRAPEETAPDAPDLEPTHAEWGVGLTAHSSLAARSQLRFLLMTRGRSAPEPPRYPGWIVLGTPPETGSLVLSQAFFVERLVAPAVREALGFEQPFVRAPGGVANSRAATTREFTRHYRDRYMSQTVAFRVIERITATIGCAFDPDADKGKRAAVVIVVRFDRTTLSRTQAERDFNTPIYSWLESSNRLELDVDADATLRATRAVDIRWALTPESKELLDRWRAMPEPYRGVYGPAADEIEAVAQNRVDALATLRPLSIALPTARLVLPEGDAFSFSDPFAGRDATMFGPACIRLSIHPKRT